MHRTGGSKPLVDTLQGAAAIDAVVSAEAWAEVVRQLPELEEQPLGMMGAPPLPNRTVAAVILWSKRTGTPIRTISPVRFGCSGRTADRRRSEWEMRGIWTKVVNLLNKYAPPASK